MGKCDGCVWNWYGDGDWCSKWSVKIDKEDNFDCKEYSIDKKEIEKLINFRYMSYETWDEKRRKQWLYERSNCKS